MHSTYDYKLHQYDPDGVNALLAYIGNFFKQVSTGQGFSIFLVRHLPGAPERLIRKLERFTVSCIKRFRGLRPFEKEATFKQKQQKMLIVAELNSNLAHLFWGEFNDNRDLFTAEQWLTFNSLAIELTSIIAALKADF